MNNGVNYFTEMFIHRIMNDRHDVNDTVIDSVE